MFIVLLSFSSSLATKYQSLNDELCMVRPTLIDLNPFELKYYPFMVSLGKCSGSCYSGNYLSTKACVPSKTKDLNLKAFNMITNRNKTKKSVNHFSYDCKCKFNRTTCNSSQKWNNETCQYEYTNYSTCKEDYSWSRSTCICENG